MNVVMCGGGGGGSGGMGMLEKNFGSRAGQSIQH